MDPDSFPRSRLFVLGAGFSKPAGLPLAVELLELVRARLRNEFRSAGWEGPLEKEVSEWQELYPHHKLTLESGTCVRSSQALPSQHQVRVW